MQDWMHNYAKRRIMLHCARKALCLAAALILLFSCASAEDVTIDVVYPNVIIRHALVYEINLFDDSFTACDEAGQAWIFDEIGRTELADEIVLIFSVIDPTEELEPGNMTIIDFYDVTACHRRCAMSLGRLEDE